MTLLVQYTILYAAILILVALGGCFSEHSGVINLGLEGIMVVGAFGGALAMKVISEQYPNLPGFFIVLIVLLVAVIFGMLFSLFLAVAAINFSADQTIIGTAMNMLATAFTVVVVKAINTAQNPDNVSATINYHAPKKAFLLKIFGFEINWVVPVMLVILVIAYIVLYKTKFGLRLMACGEFPQAAGSVGIDVFKMRYAGVLISGALGGLGGITYIITGVSEWRFEYGVAGFGFLSLAVMIFGQWKPTRIAFAAILFGLFRALSNVYSGIPFLANLNIPSAVYNMMPYVISLIVLAFTSKNSRAPKAEGIPYDKGMR